MATSNSMIGHSSVAELLQRGEQPGEILLLGEQDEINVFANLRRAVEHAGLPSHKQRLDAIGLDRRKDLSDRGRDQGCLPWPSIGRKASRFAGSARWESAPATPAIHRACLRTSRPQPNRALPESNSNCWIGPGGS